MKPPLVFTRQPALPARLSTPANAGAVLGLIGDRRLETFNRLSKAYPDGVMIRLPGKRVLVTTASASIREVLIEHHNDFTKGFGQLEAKALIGNGLLTAEGEQWRAQRTSLAPLLGAQRVQEHHAQLRHLAQESVAALPALHGEPVALRNHMAQYTLDCLSEVLGLNTPHAETVVPALDVIQDWAMIDTVAMGMLPRPLLLGGYRKLRRAQGVLHDAAAHARSNIGVDLPDWATIDGLVALFLAGYETTASTLGWAIHYLSRHPRWQAELAQEHKQAAVSPQLGSALPVATAVFKEAARLRPPVWILTRQATRDVQIADFHLRTGDNVAISLPEVHQHGWSRPAEFDPSRFMPGTKSGRMSAFGAGPRACPGGALADAEATSWLSAACATVRFVPVPGQQVRARARLSQSLPAEWLTQIRPL